MASRLQQMARDEITRVTGLTSTGLLLVGSVVGCWLLARVVAGKPLYLFSYLLLTMVVLGYVAGRRPLPVEGHRSDGRPRLFRFYKTS